MTRRKGAVFAECPEAEETFVVWDDPWPREQLRYLRYMRDVRKGREARREEPWWLGVKLTIKFLAPLWILIAVVWGLLAWGRWQRENHPGTFSYFGVRGPLQSEVEEATGEAAVIPPPIPTPWGVTPTYEPLLIGP